MVQQGLVESELARCSLEQLGFVGVAAHQSIHLHNFVLADAVSASHGLRNRKKKTEHRKKETTTKKYMSKSSQRTIVRKGREDDRRSQSLRKK